MASRFFIVVYVFSYLLTRHFIVNVSVAEHSHTSYHLTYVHDFRWIASTGWPENMATIENKTCNNIFSEINYRKQRVYCLSYRPK